MRTGGYEDVRVGGWEGRVGGYEDVRVGGKGRRV